MDIQGKELFLLALGIVLAVPPAIGISHYYFKKSFTKSLTPHLMFHATPMSGMAPETRGELNVEWSTCCNPSSNSRLRSAKAMTSSFRSGPRNKCVG